MPVEFYLLPNNMTEDPDDYVAVSRNSRTYSLEDVFEYMTRQGSTITKAEALAVFEEITQGIFQIVREGNSVVTPLVNIRSNVSGVFSGGNDTFDPRRHRVRINISPGLGFREIDKEILTEKISPLERHPIPVHFLDDTSDTRDEEITSGGGAQILGSLLKFDEADINQGVFFVNLDDDAETRVESVLRNKPSEIIFINPELPAGSYRVEVRSVLNGTTTVRTGTLSAELTVPGQTP